MRKFLNFLRDNIKIIIPITIIAVPTIVFVIILLVASAKSNTVVVGTRYRNDLDPAITEGEIGNLKDQVVTMTNVEDLEINLMTSQLRILVDAKDTIKEEDAEKLCKDIYDKVNTILPIKKYFTKDNQGQKMYDLEITVVNDPNKESNLIIYSLVKNSTMENYEVSCISKPKDPELVEELKLKEEEKNNPSADNPETTPTFTEELEDEETTDEAVE